MAHWLADAGEALINASWPALGSAQCSTAVSQFEALQVCMVTMRLYCGSSSRSAHCLRASDCHVADHSCCCVCTLQGVVRAIRNARSEFNVEVGVSVYASPTAPRLLALLMRLNLQMLRLYSTVHLTPTLTWPPAC
jgi:hypothetical protein